LATIAETVRRLLADAPGEELCDACLAFACARSLTEMRVVTEALVRSDSAFHRGSSCASCRRTVPKTVYYADAPRKCSQCSRPLIEGEEGVMLEDALFHAVCLRRLVTDDAIRMSRHLSQRSRQLIEQSRRRTREARGAHGV
jgi:hypothetical protein